jgi:glutathione peroxidase
MYSTKMYSIMKNSTMYFPKLLLSLGVIVVLLFAPTGMLVAQTQKTKTFHDFKVKTIDGKVYDLSKLKGKKVLVVNTASKCGLTPQYEILQKLYDKLDKKKFELIGFPANNFLSQEPGTDAEIKEFCQKNYGVTFPIMEKVSVSNYMYTSHPSDTSKAEKTTTAEIYQWLTKKELNGVMDSRVEWNFQKYLIDENGKLIGTIPPRVGKELLLMFDFFSN